MSRPSALLVDDHPETLRLLELQLEEILDPTRATGAEEALDVAGAREVPFDLLILDIHLPGDRTGTDLLAAIRKRPGYAEVPALACTARAMPGDREALLEAGFDAYLSKPFLRAEFLEAARGLLEGGARTDKPTDG